MMGAMSSIKIHHLGLLAPVLFGCATKPETWSEPTVATAPASAAPDPTADKLKAALAGAHRAPENAARDVHRHPFETLTFFGLRHDMTVVELAPGAGWYTEILAPVLRDEGTLRVTSENPQGDPNAYGTRRARELSALLDKNAEVFGKVEVAIIAPPDSFPLGAPGSADIVVSFRNLHGWLRSGQADAILAGVAAVLKSGGVFGLVDHRGNAQSKPDSGYVSEEAAIAAVEKAGLKLVEKSEVNANPEDTKDYEAGVWTLPPTLRLKDKDREKYTAIGESDRFTMKFVKP